jgi:hypothetical protein
MASRKLCGPIVLLATFLTGCNAAENALTSLKDRIDSSGSGESTDVIEVAEGGDAHRQLCAVSEGNEAIATCREGQIFLFRPSRWGNEQLPVTVAAVFCNFNHPIVYNNGAVSCVYTELREGSW